MNFKVFPQKSTQLNFCCCIVRALFRLAERLLFLVLAMKPFLLVDFTNLAKVAAVGLAKSRFNIEVGILGHGIPLVNQGIVLRKALDLG